MIAALINLCVYLIIAGVIYWAVVTILGVVPLPEPIKQVVRVLLIVILVLIIVYALLGLIGVVGHGPVLVR